MTVVVKTPKSCMSQTASLSQIWSEHSIGKVKTKTALRRKGPAGILFCEVWSGCHLRTLVKLMNCWLTLQGQVIHFIMIIITTNTWWQTGSIITTLLLSYYSVIYILKQHCITVAPLGTQALVHYLKNVMTCYVPNSEYCKQWISF